MLIRQLCGVGSIQQKETRAHTTYEILKSESAARTRTATATTSAAETTTGAAATATPTLTPTKKEDVNKNDCSRDVGGGDGVGGQRGEFATRVSPSAALHIAASSFGVLENDQTTCDTYMMSGGGGQLGGLISLYKEEEQ